jgi:actin-related protein 8
VQQALRLSDPQQSGYTANWPIYRNNFNTRDYYSLQVILSDLEVLLGKTLKDRFDVEIQDYKVDVIIHPNEPQYNDRIALLRRARYT